MACGLSLFPHSKQPLLWSRVHGLRAEDGGPTKRRASSCFCRFSSSALIASCLFISCPCSNLPVRSLGGLMPYFLGGAFSSSLTLCHKTRGKGLAATHTLDPGVCRLSEPKHRKSLSSRPVTVGMSSHFPNRSNFTRLNLPNADRPVPV